jgi:hypothetical protein
MSDRGQVFFTTSDALVPRDTNGLLDTYQFAGGRPQLISSGAAPTDVGLGDDPSGLVGVSADGVDVYFTTTESLVAEDSNGRATRFYDARASGGFQRPAPELPCEAADECRGATSTPAPPARLGSDADLGAGGNATPTLNRCARMGRVAHRHARRARALRKRADRLMRGDRQAAQRAKRLRASARRSAEQARRAASQAKRCRGARGAQSQRRPAR